MADIRTLPAVIADSRQRGVDKAARSRSASVPAVARAARLLDELASTRQALSLAALVKALELPKSSVHGLCATLVQAGLVERLDDGSFQLGARVMDLAHAYMARTDVAAEFQTVVKEESPMPEESLVLSVLDGADIVYVACRNGSRTFGFSFRIGMRLPANCTASGKAMLASMPVERVVGHAVSGAFYALTRKSITRPEPLVEHLRKVAAQGYAVDDEETRRGMVCIGAPIFGPASPEAIAAVAISLPRSSLDAQRRALALETVTRLADRISHRLGARPGGPAPRRNVRSGPARKRGAAGCDPTRQLPAANAPRSFPRA